MLSNTWQQLVVDYKLMADFEKHQIRRQGINDELPLKLVNLLDYQQNTIKDSFSLKSRYILPKSENKNLSVDDEFKYAFDTLSLDEKIDLYSKQVSLLCSIFQQGGTLSQADPRPRKDLRLNCRIKGKGLGGQWQELSVFIQPSRCQIEVPLKAGIQRIDLHDYLVRQAKQNGKNQIILEAQKPNIIKHWRLLFDDSDRQEALMAIVGMADKAQKDRLQEDIKMFRQSRIVQSKSTLKRKSQIWATRPLMDYSKYSSQVVDPSVSAVRQKRRVNFQSDTRMFAANIREQASIIQIIPQIQLSDDYERLQPEDLFATDEDWFIKILGDTYKICQHVFGDLGVEDILQPEGAVNVIYQNGPNLITQSRSDHHKFRVEARISLPREMVLAAICQIQNASIWNTSVLEGKLKLRIPASNVLINQIKLKPFNNKFRPRQFLYLSHFFKKRSSWYILGVGIKNSYYPVQNQSVRAKMPRSLIRLKQEDGRTTYSAVFELNHQGSLDDNQQTELSKRFLSGIFQLQGCLKDRVFVENKASHYFNLQWSNERQSKFTLGKNGVLDDTGLFTENLCSEICSFYSAQGPADWGNLDEQDQIYDQNRNNMILNYQQQPNLFRKDKSNVVESQVRSKPNIPRPVPSKLPFKIPIKNNKVILTQSTKQMMEKYLREKEEERIQHEISLRRGNLQVIRQTPSSPSKLAQMPLRLSKQLPSKLASYVSNLSKPSIQVISSTNLIPVPSSQRISGVKQVASPPPIQRSKATIRKDSDSISDLSLNNSMLASKLRKRKVSQVQIDKYNQTQHIVPFTQINIHPDTGQVILPQDYIEKWVSPLPITIAKPRPYKGDNWDHFFFRDLWTVLPNGEVKCIDQVKLKAQSSAIKIILKRFASNVMSGKGILNVSLPVEIFSEMSCLELFSRSLCLAPNLLQGAANNDNALERFKIVTAFSLAASLLYVQMEKPFNPILGQTFQGWIQGCPVYCEQVSHHPPISAFYFVGRGYTISGRLQPKIDLSVNSGVGENKGEFTIKFDKYPNNPICTQSPPGEIGGLAYGDRKFNFTGKSYSYDWQGLFCQLTFNPTKKGMFSLGKQLKQSDYVKGAIYKVDLSFIQAYRSAPPNKRQGPNPKNTIQTICDVQGRWTVGLSFGGVQYFNVLNSRPTMLQQEKYPLNSNSNYREDIYFRRQQQYDRAQSEKQRLEILQRNDKKLRQKFHPKKH